MKRSEERILTTHVGSLPRERELSDLLIADEARETVDRDRLDELAAKIDRASAEQQIQLSLESAAVKRKFWVDTILVRARYAREAGFHGKAQDLETVASRLAAGPATGTPRPRSESPALQK